VNWTTVPILLSALLTVVVVVFRVFTPIYIWWRRRRVPGESTETLQALIRTPRNYYLYGPAIIALHTREEEYSAVLPHLLYMCIEGDNKIRMIGWDLLRIYFPRHVENIEFDYRKPTEVAKEKLRYLASRPSEY